LGRVKAVSKKLKILLSLIAVILSIGCHPYYNTFYNAKEAFRSAHRPHSKLMRMFPDSLVVTPTAEMEARYSRAIEKSLKMMEVYPRDRKNRDKAHFLMGRSSFYTKEFEVSISRMRDLQIEFPESPSVPQSHIYVAKSHILLDNLAMAEEILHKFLEDYPQFDKNQEITMLLVEIALRREGRSQALGLLSTLRLSSLPLEKRIDIILRMADLHYDLGQYSTALGLLHGAPRSKKHPYLMYRIDRSFYFCYDVMDSLSAALAHLERMHRNRNYREHRNEILFYKAVTLAKLGNVDGAIAILTDITRMCEKGGPSDTASLCGRAYYELALLYQMNKGDYALAMDAFERAAGFNDPALAGAHQRLVALRRLFELRRGDSTGVVTPAARYSIAELFWLDLAEPDSAYFYYMELSSDSTVTDSLLRPQSLIMAASVARSAAVADTVRSDSLLKLVIDGYPGTELAKRAQAGMDVDITVTTRRDLAERDFGAAEAVMESNMVEAVKSFYNIFKQYPDLDIAAKSLHASAWYSDNSLQKNRAAMRLYEELCDKYPESDYCVNSAEPRLAAARDTLSARKAGRDKKTSDQGAAPLSADSSSADSAAPADDSPNTMDITDVADTGGTDLDDSDLDSDNSAEPEISAPDDQN
jgi:TolA-binding protein